jgi:hypothetical protein
VGRTEWEDIEENLLDEEPETDWVFRFFFFFFLFVDGMVAVPLPTPS